MSLCSCFICGGHCICLIAKWSKDHSQQTNRKSNSVLIVVSFTYRYIYTHTISQICIPMKTQPSYRERIAHCHSHIPVKVREAQRPAQMAFVLNQQLFQSVVKQSHVELIHTLTHLQFAFKQHGKPYTYIKHHWIIQTTLYPWTYNLTQAFGFLSLILIL